MTGPLESTTCGFAFGLNRPSGKAAPLFLLLLLAGEFGSDGRSINFFYARSTATAHFTY